MKKRTLIIVVALLTLLLTVPAPAFAYEPWDVEDPCVADSGDFIWGVGWDGSSAESYYGEQSWSYYPTPSDGYNLYRDDATDTGNLDEINDLITRTPDAIEGLSIEWAFPELDGGFWYMGGASPDTWYWALAPRGYNLPAPQEGYDRYKGLSGVFWVEVFNYGGFNTYKWDDWSSADRVIRDPLIARGEVTGVNAVQCTLYIPEGTHLSYPGRPGTLVTNLSIERDGSGVRFEPGNMDFSQPCSLLLAYPDGTEEVLTFNQIRDGLPVPMAEVAPASSAASPAWIYGT